MSPPDRVVRKGGCVPDPMTEWLLSKHERGNPQTRLDDQHPGDAGVVGGQPGPPADPRLDVLRGAVRADRGHPRRRPRLLHRLAGRRRRAADGRARQRGGRGARPRRRARCRRTRPGLALAQGRVRVHRAREQAARPRAAASVAPRRCSTCGSGSAGRTTRRCSSSGTATTRPATSRTSAASTCATRAATTPTTRGDPQAQPNLAEEYGRTRPGTTPRRRSAGPRCTTWRRSSASAGRTRRR